MKPQRVEILGVPVDCVTMAQAVQWVETSLISDQTHSVIAVNPEKVMRACQDPELLKHLQKAGLLIPDGIGVIFAVRLLGLGQIARVPGSELMPKLCDRAAKKGYKVFLFGASQEVIVQVAQVLLRISLLEETVM